MSLNKNDVSLIREAIKEEVDSLLDIRLTPIHDKLDGLAKGLADLRGEQFAHQAAHDRYEGWFQKIAGKIGLKLSA